MKLSGLSAQEINMRVAKVKFPDAVEVIGYSDGTVYIQHDSEVFSLLSWVDSDALAFRIMVDNHIDLKELVISKSYSAADMFDYEVHSINENPNRAIAECYLLINGVES